MTAPTLTEFLLARIAEDEEWAPTRHTILCLRTGCETCIFADDEHAIAAERVCTCGYPARVLAECEAKRDIVNLYGHIQLGEGVDGYPVPLGGAGPETYWNVLCLLALPYEDHPDYNPEWRP